MRDPELQMLLDERAIRRKLNDYARGADRMDKKLYQSVYWPDATDEHIAFSGNAMDFVEHAFSALTDVRSHLMLGQINIDFDDTAHAKVETYYRAYQERSHADVATASQPDSDAKPTEILVSGRYLDLFEKRGEEWRIKHRMMLVDYYQTGPTTSDWINGRYRKARYRGERGPQDPLYTILGVKRA
jgi:hypothetical protein